MKLESSFLYKELPHEKRNEFFKKCRDKFLPNTDNIYYNVYLKNDVSERHLLKQIFQDPENFYDKNKDDFTLKSYVDLFCDENGDLLSLSSFCDKWDVKKLKDKCFQTWANIDEMISFLENRRIAARNLKENVSLSELGGTEIGLKILEMVGCENLDACAANDIIERLRSYNEFFERKSYDELCQYVLFERDLLDLNLSMLYVSNRNFSYVLTDNKFFDIMIARSLRNNVTPRVQIQLRAIGLWSCGAEGLILKSYEKLVDFLSLFGFSPDDICMVTENRLDYCYHTNIFKNLDDFLSDRHCAAHVKTTLRQYSVIGRVGSRDGFKSSHCMDYVSYGCRKSNHVFVRIYDKTREVIEMGYKGLFYDIWFENGVISFYDKWCYDFVYNAGVTNYDYLGAARLYFYLEFGQNDAVKKEINALLSDKNATNVGFKALADKYTPDLTTVINIEYQTKRGFYSLCDDQIDNFFKVKNNENPRVLDRLFKIVDNRRVFLDALTSQTFSFRREGSDDYLWWWERLRNTKIDCLKKKCVMERKYTRDINKGGIFNKIISSVSSLAALNERDDTFFNDDFKAVMDDFSSLNDNDKQRFLNDYRRKKYKKSFIYKSNEKSVFENMVFRPFFRRKSGRGLLAVCSV